MVEFHERKSSVTNLKMIIKKQWIQWIALTFGGLKMEKTIEMILSILIFD